MVEPTSTDGMELRPMYSRILLKLGGEMFGGGSVGLDPDVVAQVARQIAEVVRSGVQVAVVIGGGNFFRGAQLQQRGMERTRSDYMGMLGTVMNSLALQDFLEKEGIVTRVQTDRAAPEHLPAEFEQNACILGPQFHAVGARRLNHRAPHDLSATGTLILPHGREVTTRTRSAPSTENRCELARARG
jgi:hypothetical protein